MDNESAKDGILRVGLSPLHWGHFGYVKRDGKMAVIVDDEDGGKLKIAEGNLSWCEIFWAKKKARVLIECLGGNRCKVLRVVAQDGGKLRLIHRKATGKKERGNPPGTQYEKSLTAQNREGTNQMGDRLRMATPS